VDIRDWQAANSGLVYQFDTEEESLHVQLHTKHFRHGVNELIRRVLST